jgi:hypothetical protein
MYEYTLMNFDLQMRNAMLGEGHIRMLGTLQIGHTIHDGHQRLQCWPSPNMTYHYHNRAYFVFTRPPGLELFMLNPDNVWYGWLKLIFTMSVKIDDKEEPVDMECEYVIFCYEIKLKPSGMY